MSPARAFREEVSDQVPDHGEAGADKTKNKEKWKRREGMSHPSFFYIENGKS